MLISLALIGSDVNLLCSDWFHSSVKHKTCVCVCPCLRTCLCFCVCVFEYMHMCVRMRLLCFFCVFACAHSTDTVTSPSVMVLIVQMVKLAAPTKQQTIYSNKYTQMQTQRHTDTNHLLGLLVWTIHVHAC